MKNPDKMSTRELRAEVKSRRWISVEDRLPEYQEQWDGKTFVVALFEPNNYDQWSGRVQSMTSTFLLNYLEAKIVMQSSGAITHWMNLPDAPHVS